MNPFSENSDPVVDDGVLTPPLIGCSSCSCAKTMMHCHC